MSGAEELFASLSEVVTSPPVECVVFGWGANEDGQLGFDGGDCVFTPRIVDAVLGYRLRGRAIGCNPLVAGSRNTLLLSQATHFASSPQKSDLSIQEGLVWSWGWNDRGTLGRASKSTDKSTSSTVAFRNVSIVQAAIGGWHCLAIDAHGQVYAWGGNEYKQCGLDVSSRDVITPTPVVPHLCIKQVACGGMHSLALTKEGEVWMWGEPWGDFSMSHQKAPRCVRKTHDTIMIACGAFHNMALDNRGQVYTWGMNDYGQLGDGGTKYTTYPTKVVDLEDTVIVDIAAGGWHSVAVSRDGRVYTWGRGEYGRLGLGDTSGSSRLRPQRVPGLDNHHIVQASAGGTHTLCLTSNGVIFAWGRASFGRLGNKDSIRDRYVPKEVELPGGSHRWRVLAIACGGRHSLCLALPTLNEAAGHETSDGSRGDDEESEELTCDLQISTTLDTEEPSTPVYAHLLSTSVERLGTNLEEAMWVVDHEDDG